MKIKRLLFPAKCIFCNRILQPDEKHICSYCEKNIKNFHTALKRSGAFFDIAYGFLPYSGNVRRAIHRYKYYGKIHYAEYLAEKMALRYGREEESIPDIITAVPSHRRRRAKRGFDHAFLLAENVGKRLGVNAEHLLKKKSATPPMYGLNGEQRRANVRGSIALSCDTQRLWDKHILLIDDILTTGSTASECARVLKSAGAKKVTVLVAAMTEKKR